MMSITPTGHTLMRARKAIAKLALTVGTRDIAALILLNQARKEQNYEMYVALVRATNPEQP